MLPLVYRIGDFLLMLSSQQLGFSGSHGQREAISRGHRQLLLQFLLRGAIYQSSLPLACTSLIPTKP